MLKYNDWCSWKFCSCLLVYCFCIRLIKLRHQLTNAQNYKVSHVLKLIAVQSDENIDIHSQGLAWRLAVKLIWATIQSVIGVPRLPLPTGYLVSSEFSRLRSSHSQPWHYGPDYNIRCIYAYKIVDSNSPGWLTDWLVYCLAGWLSAGGGLSSGFYESNNAVPNYQNPLGPRHTSNWINL